jgi:hypothetical protein
MFVIMISTHVGYPVYMYDTCMSCAHVHMSCMSCMYDVYGKDVCRSLTCELCEIERFSENLRIAVKKSSNRAAAK